MQVDKRAKSDDGEKSYNEAETSTAPTTTILTTAKRHLSLLLRFRMRTLRIYKSGEKDKMLVKTET